MKVAVFTTSYPRHEGDLAGRFVYDLVEHVRECGVEIEVVGPGAYNDYGLTGSSGAGLVASARKRPWLAPPLAWSMVRSLRRAARDADLVHANWLAGAKIARFSGKPFIVTLHGSGTAGRFSDLGLADRSPGLVRRLLRPARAVICCSQPLAVAMRGIGIANVHEIPYGVEIPADTGAEEEPPTVLFAGRLSPEKRIDVVAAATEGLPRIVAGDGPLRDLLPDALGFVPQNELFGLFERAAVVVLASENEGLPNVVLEAMARGRTVVSTPVGGIPTVIEDGVTGFLVPVGDVAATRAAIERALADPELRRRIGEAARERVRDYCSWEKVTEQTLEVYAEAS
ncbi:MAG TPA: glycosyltransferase family 4 protein [Gaiellaceae bacterium]|nr:glycosyltransferase family 4 protein [Gaiellaceae bacterium]